MKYSRNHVVLILMLACAVGFVKLMADDADLVNAKTLPRSLFTSPPPDEIQPGQSQEVRDPDTPNVSAFIPTDTIMVPAKFEAYYTGLPENIPPVTKSSIQILNNASDEDRDDDPIQPIQPPVPDVVELFAAGLWRGVSVKGEASPIYRFNHSIVITMKYEYNGNFSQDQLRMYMYNSFIKDWVKLCSIIDPALKEVSGLVSTMSPYETGGNALFAVAIDHTSPPEQDVKKDGTTFVSLPEVDGVIVQVPPGTVPVGGHFEITPITHTVSSTIMDFKVCHINHTPKRQRQESYQLENLSNPLTIDFSYQANLPGRNGILLILHQNQWSDIEDLSSIASLIEVEPAYKIVGSKIVARINTPGTYGFKSEPE